MFSIHLPSKQLLAVLALFDSGIEDTRPELLTVLGTRLLGLMQQSFVKKSKGGAGDDGITWKPLDPKTIRRKAKKGAANDKRKKQTTKSGKARPAIGSVMIGVDLGLLRASSTPGYRAPEGLGGNVFEVKGLGVTVGYGMIYAKYFDELRPLAPDDLPDKWRSILEAIATAWLERIIIEKGGGLFHVNDISSMGTSQDQAI